MRTPHVTNRRHYGAGDRRAAVILALGVSTAVIGSTAHAQSFASLGGLPDAEYTATGVSANGTVVVGTMFRYTAAGTEREAFRWNAATGFIGLGDLPGGLFESSAAGVSADGSVVVGTGSSAAFGSEAFRWTAAGGMVGLSTLPATYRWSEALGVSADGSVVVGASGVPPTVNEWDGIEPFRWTLGAGLQGLGHVSLSSPYALAYAISGNGAVVVGGATYIELNEAFRWSLPIGAQGLGRLTSGELRGSTAFAANADGSVIVGIGDSSGFSMDTGLSGTAFRWTPAGGMQVLGPSGPNTGSRAYGVSGDGSVIVGSISRGWFGDEAFVWTASLGIVGLEEHLLSLGVNGLTGWTLSTATAVSADGRTIIGSGRSPDGYTRSWIARLSGAVPICPGDFNGSGGSASIQDVFDFVGAYFANDPRADVNLTGGVSPEDIFDFLAAYFAGCP